MITEGWNIRLDAPKSFQETAWVCFREMQLLVPCRPRAAARSLTAPVWVAAANDALLAQPGAVGAGGGGQTQVGSFQAPWKQENGGWGSAEIPNGKTLAEPWGGQHSGKNDEGRAAGKLPGGKQPGGVGDSA